MKTIEDTVKTIEVVLATLSGTGYANILIDVSEARIEQGPAEKELTLDAASISTPGITDIMVSLKQDRYDQLISNVNARRHRR